MADDPAFARELTDYFPAKMRADYISDIEQHRLRREIIVNTVSNFLVNRCGPTFAMQVADRTGAGPDAITRAYVAAREVFGLRDFNGRIDALDNAVSGTRQLALYQEARDLVHDRTVWFLANTSFSEGLESVIALHSTAVAGLDRELDAIIPARLEARIERRTEALVGDGVPADLARDTARLPVLAAAPDICNVAQTAEAMLTEAGTVFFQVGEVFRIARIGELATVLPVTDYYDGLALDRALEALATVHRLLTESVLSAVHTGREVDVWLDAAGPSAQRTLDAVAAITESEELTVSRVSVAAGLLADFCRARGA